MRSRPLFVRHAPLRRLRRLVSAVRPRSTGIAAPLAVAIVLAVTGSQLEAVRPAAGASSAVAGTQLPERVVRGAHAPLGLTTEKVSGPVRTAPGKAAPRATRSRTRAAAAPRKAWTRPSGGALTSYYGMRWGRMHRGIDLGASYGSPIYAAGAGVVSFAGPQGGYGRLVTIRHDGGWTTAYGHMSRIVVRSGQKVSAGQIIAYVGSAGHSTGPHLHFEVRTAGGAFINPLPFLRSRGVRI